jgi:hypothetical protein
LYLFFGGGRIMQDRCHKGPVFSYTLISNILALSYPFVASIRIFMLSQTGGSSKERMFCL